MPTERGTPPCGVASPLLANIALHVMEQVVSRRRRGHEIVRLVRYADDFVILHSDRAILEESANDITAWLKEIGLELKPSKTKTTHTLTTVEGIVGFDFLGFAIRQFLVGKHHSGTHPHGNRLGFKTIITPSKEAILRHTHDLKHRLRKLTAAPHEGVIKDLNPVIRGWANYYRTVSSTNAFSWCDHIPYRQLLQWAKRKHPTRGAKWVVHTYWRTKERRRWVFMTPEETNCSYTVRRESPTCEGTRSSKPL